MRSTEYRSSDWQASSRWRLGGLGEERSHRCARATGMPYRNRLPPGGLTTEAVRSTVSGDAVQNSNKVGTARSAVLDITLKARE